MMPCKLMVNSAIQARLLRPSLHQPSYLRTVRHAVSLRTVNKLRSRPHCSKLETVPLVLSSIPYSSKLTSDSKLINDSKSTKTSESTGSSQSSGSEDKARYR